MKPGESLPLKDVLNPKVPPRAEMVETVPPPPMVKPVQAPQLEVQPGQSGFVGCNLDGNNYMAPITYDPRWLPRWIRITLYVFAAVNALWLVAWLLMPLTNAFSKL